MAESTWGYAQEVADGNIKDPSIFFFHRQASDDHDLKTEHGARAAVIEASGPAAEWSDIDGIVGLWRDPTFDDAYFERVYTNRLVQQSAQAFDPVRFTDLARPENRTQPGALIVAGFDGSVGGDDTAIVGTVVATGHQFVIGHWAHPGRKFSDWRVPREEVDLAIDKMFRTTTSGASTATPGCGKTRSPIGRAATVATRWPSSPPTRPGWSAPSGPMATRSRTIN